MLNLKELNDALKFERMAPRTEGCFGSPFSGSDVSYAQSPPKHSEKPHSNVVRYEHFEAPRTGEPLYRPVA